MNHLPSSSYTAPLARTQKSTLIKEPPKPKYTRAVPPRSVAMPPPKTDSSDLEDDFPTPRANTQYARSIDSLTGASSHAKGWRNSTSSTGTDFEDDLYGSPSDDEQSDDGSEVVPFKVSGSIKKILASPERGDFRPSSLVIPSPALWPNVQKSSTAGCPPLLSPQTPLSPTALSRLAASSRLQVPSQSTIPSLAGSVTSEEVSNTSCPSTPDTRGGDINQGEWDAELDSPVQLHPDAMETLLQISCALQYPESQENVMIEIVGAPSRVQQQMTERGLNISITIPQTRAEVEDDELSALSVPSPGGFFASLNTPSSHVWSFSTAPSAPSTSMAETFYGVPWQNDESQVLERIVELDENRSDGPPTARRITNPNEAQSPVSQDNENDTMQDYDEEYERKLRETAVSNISRTSVWLQAQNVCESPIEGSSTKSDTSIPPTPETPGPSATAQTFSSPSDVSPSKKSVRFADDAAASPGGSQGGTVSSDSLIYRAFQHFRNKSHARDAFTHREARAEAMRTQRHYLPQSHIARLSGSYRIVALTGARKDSAALRPVAGDVESDAERAVVAAATKEQQALEQVKLSCFDLEADRFLSGGSILPKQAATLLSERIRAGRGARVLDLCGEPTASWGWAIANEYREAKVYTAVLGSFAAHADWTAHRGPSNHRTVAVPNLWTLPFPSESFDVVSARTLHTLLRNTSPTRDGGDEYDATLQEIRRVLTPDGYMHFKLLDAEVAASSKSALAAKSVEFAVSLRTRGYDSSAGRHFVGRLERAGFGEVRRSWMRLPLASAPSTEMDRVTGMVGALSWERWMLRLQREIGKPEERLLEGVAKAMDEAVAGGEGAAWRMLVGCARKE